MIYLNDGFEGGLTNYVEKIDTTDQKNQYRTIYSVVPKAGTAIIFNHDVLHEGSVLLSGIKYIMRTEIMFRRISFSSELQTTNNSEEYYTALNLYQKAGIAELAGDVKGSTEYYIKAQELQAQIKSLSNSTIISPVKSTINSLPNEVLVLIFQFLSIKQLNTVILVNKRWHTIGKDYQLWKQVYFNNFPKLASIEKKLRE